MQIPKIGGSNNIQFKKIYRSNVLSEQQEKLADDIENKIKNPVCYDGTPVSGFYSKSINRMNFYISQSNIYPDAVTLKRIYGVKEESDGISDTITYNQNSVFIGHYDKDHLFKVDDIQLAMERKGQQNIGTTLIELIVAAGLITACVLKFLHGSKPETQNTKPLIESVDSLSNTLKQIPKNTIRF